MKRFISPWLCTQLRSKPLAERFSSKETGFYICSTFRFSSNINHVVKVPLLDSGNSDGRVIEWRVRPGDHVKLNDSLCVIEDGKVQVSVQANHAGRIVSHIPAGQIVATGTDLAEIAPADVTAAGKHHYAGSIRFRYGYNQAHDGGVSSTMEQSAIAKECVPKGIHRVERFESGADLPLRMKHPELTDEEIELVNTGGGCPDLDRRVGIWRSEISRI